MSPLAFFPVGSGGITRLFLPGMSMCGWEVGIFLRGGKETVRYQVPMCLGA